MTYRSRDGKAPLCATFQTFGCSIVDLLELPEKNNHSGQDIKSELLERIQGNTGVSESKDEATSTIKVADTTNKVKKCDNNGVNAKEEDGVTALLKAASQGHTVAVELLLEAGAAPNSCRSDGATALHYAAYGGHVATVQALQRAGADPNSKDEGGNRPVEYAMMASDHARVAFSLLVSQ